MKISAGTWNRTLKPMTPMNQTQRIWSFRKAIKCMVFIHFGTYLTMKLTYSHCDLFVIFHLPQRTASCSSLYFYKLGYLLTSIFPLSHSSSFFFNWYFIFLKQFIQGTRANDSIHKQILKVTNNFTYACFAQVVMVNGQMKHIFGLRIRTPD